MTALAMQGDKERCIGAGMDEYVPKPIQPMELAEAIDRQLSDLPRAEPKVINHGAEPGREVFDRAALLDRLGGDEELCNEILSVFFKDVPTQLEELKQALDDHDVELVERKAHTIKGSSANIGAQALSHAALEMETAGKERELDEVCSLVIKFESEFEKLRMVLSWRDF
jgi:HPt (histidine-containing phosphotransfer) domain-containing protein